MDHQPSASNREQRFWEILLHEPDPPTGQTPKEIIWRKNKSKLYRFFHPLAPSRYKTPVVFVYSMVNRPYILDLIPGFSFVEYLLAKGHPVYLLDWGEAGPEDAQFTLADYILDYLHKAILSVVRHTGGEPVTLAGYCMGGTIAAMYAAVLPEYVKNIVLIAAPFHFEHEFYSLWFKEEYFSADQFADAFGNVPARLVYLGTRMLKPVPHFLGLYKNLYEQTEDLQYVKLWKAIHRWTHDGVPFPGGVFRDWIRLFYQKNLLLEDGVFLRDRQVRLSELHCPLLFLIAEKDHIIPPPQTEAVLGKLAGREVSVHRYPGGHLSLVTGPVAAGRVYPETESWLVRHQ
jgi:polyhydroxyalkanoate synthase